LEQNKGEGLHHLFPEDLRWFGKTGEYYKHGKLCVDHVSVDAEGYTCADYGNASAGRMPRQNAIDVVPNQACCGVRR
jgi:hypothetical protein